MNDFSLTKQKKVEVEGLRSLQVVGSVNIQTGELEKLAEIEIQSAEKTQDNKQEGVYIPP